MFNLRAEVKKVLFTYLNSKRLCRHTREMIKERHKRKCEVILIQNSILIFDIENRKEIQLNNSINRFILSRFFLINFCA